VDTNIARELLKLHADFVGAEPLVEGLSSPRVANFLNRLVARLAPGETYLEIGTWKGLTLISAAFDNPSKVCIGCDRFRAWGRFTGPGVLARRALAKNLKRYRARSAKIRVFAMKSCELFRRRLLGAPVGVYFYDGDHSYESTHHGMVAASPFLAERSVVLVDDWNDREIRRATFDGLEQASLRVVWRRALPGDHTTLGWWNGLGVFCVEKTRGALRLPEREVTSSLRP
jgi:Methyltransferase domain